MISMGSTCDRPAPAAPPLMPNTGPSDGCRTTTVARRPSRPSPCTSPTAVVVLPSPSGVGVMAVTTTYRAVDAAAAGPAAATASSSILATRRP